MNRKFASAVFVFACLMAGGRFAPDTTARAQTKPVVFTVTPKPVAGRLQLGDGSDFAIRGRASLTVTAANENDTLTGTLVYTLPDDARRKIAAAVGNGSLKDVPVSVTLKDVKANFRRGTACPLLRLEVLATEAAAGDAKILFDRIVLDIQESPDQMNQLFCSWTRQINAQRQRRGVIAAINRLIKPAD